LRFKALDRNVRKEGCHLSAEIPAVDEEASGKKEKNFS
jgi:hypothetical protein